MTMLKPFADDVASQSVGKLTIENGTGQLSTYGSLDITRDQQRLALAQAWQLKALLDATVAVLEGQPDLLQALPTAAAPRTVRNRQPLRPRQLRRVAVGIGLHPAAKCRTFCSAGPSHTPEPGTTT